MNAEKGISPPRKRKRIASPKKKRSPFSAQSVHLLEKAYLLNKYPDYTWRSHLADLLQEDECRIHVWFQNRRAREKKKRVKCSPPSDKVQEHTTECQFEDSSNGDTFQLLSYAQTPAKPPTSLSDRRTTRPPSLPATCITDAPTEMPVQTYFTPRGYIQPMNFIPFCPVSGPFPVLPSANAFFPAIPLACTPHSGPCAPAIVGCSTFGSVQCSSPIWSPGSSTFSRLFEFPPLPSHSSASAEAASHSF